jgi:hypothetical protein
MEANQQKAQFYWTLRARVPESFAKVAGEVQEELAADDKRSFAPSAAALSRLRT